MSAGSTSAGPGGAEQPSYRSWLLRVLRVPFWWLSHVLWRLTTQGLHHVPHSGPVLLLGNHEGLLDGPLVVVTCRRPVRALAKAELYRGWVGRLLHAVGQIPVHRGRPDRAALREAVGVLVSGGALAIFPEGTRGAGSVEEIQHGAAYVLLRSGLKDVPVVPVHCTGTARALPKGGRLRLRAPVLVRYGPPFTVALPTNGHARTAVADVAEQLRRHLAAHVATGVSTPPTRMREAGA